MKIIVPECDGEREHVEQYCEDGADVGGVKHELPQAGRPRDGHGQFTPLYQTLHADWAGGGGHRVGGAAAAAVSAAHEGGGDGHGALAAEKV